MQTSQGTIIEAGSSGPNGASAATAFKLCPRRYALSYEPDSNGQPPQRGPHSRATWRGTLVHTGLAQHYARLYESQEGRPPDSYALPEEAITIQGQAELHRFPEVPAMAWQLVRGHIDHWAAEEITWKIVGVEVLFHVDFTTEIGNARRSGRADLVYQDTTNGRYYVVDHKTASRVNDALLLDYARSDQFCALHYGGKQAFGAAFGGVVCNFIQNDGRFSRPPLPPVPGHIAGYPTTVTWFASQRDQLRAGRLPPGQWPMASSTQACRTRYGPCPHAKLCQWDL